MSIKHVRSGQSLVEVVVTVGVIVLVLVALISAITIGLNNAQYARSKAQASKYAQEAIEWLHGQRDLNWSAFYARGSPGVGRTYCFSSLSFALATSCAPNQVISDQYRIFIREVTLIQNATDQVGVNVRVAWQQGTRPAQVLVNTYMSNWQQ